MRPFSFAGLAGESRGRTVIEASNKKTAEDDAGGALALRRHCVGRLRALSFGRLGVVGATADQTDSAPLALWATGAPSPRLAATDDPVAAAKAPARPRSGGRGRVLGGLRKRGLGAEKAGDDDEQLWLDDGPRTTGPAYC